MSHLHRVALSALLAAAACSAPKPPETPASSEAAATAGGAASTSDPSGAQDPSTALAPSAASSAAPANPAEAPARETLFVRDQLADCQSEGARRCLQVRETESEPWRNLYAPIDGFDYEPSYAYELRVEVSPVANAPADASALRYRLLEIVAKHKAK
jgi:hypothetical protein